MLSLCIDIQKLISKLYDKQTLKLEEITRINLNTFYFLKASTALQLQERLGKQHKIINTYTVSKGYKVGEINANRQIDWSR